MSKILTSSIIEGFVGSVLLKGFDAPTPIPECHREWWTYCCDSHRFVALAAPRGFAKSTAITYSYVLAATLFREREYVLIISGTEAQSILFLNDIKATLMENENIKRLFGEMSLLKDSETDIIVEMQDGHRFRIQAKGSEQRLRGTKWANRRPDLVVCHKKDTLVYTPETGWIKNQDYPGAQLLPSTENYEIEFENGTTEIVTGHHRYLTDKGWTFAWQLTADDNLCENITDATANDILKHEKNPFINTTLRQKLLRIVDGGLKRILIWMLLQNKPVMSGTKKNTLWLLESLLRIILHGRQLIVRNVGQGS